MDSLGSISSFVMVSVVAKISLSWIKRSTTTGGMRRLSTRTIDPTELAKLRKEYSQKGLLENPEEIDGGPEAIFASWLGEAKESNVPEPNAMCLSTCMNDVPSARFVLLKTMDTRGFVWFTNYNSSKGQHLAANPRAALTFFWPQLERQVRVEGHVEKISAEESDRYFAIRPRSAQIGAWSSNQSESIGSRALLEQQHQAAVDRFRDAAEIPRPDHWGGFRLVPQSFEFWVGSASRLHDRIFFERSAGATDSTWNVKRLQP